MKSCLVIASDQVHSQSMSMSNHKFKLSEFHSQLGQSK